MISSHSSSDPAPRNSIPPSGIMRNLKRISIAGFWSTNKLILFNLYNADVSRKVVISTGFDRAYFPKTRDYIDSVAEHGEFDDYVALCLNFLPNESEVCEPWRYVYTNEHQVIAPHSNRCMQHGAFISFLNLDHDDVVLFTDSDMRMQRRMWPEEMDILRKLKHGEVFVGENKDANETLYEEAKYLRPFVPVESLTDVFKDTNIKTSKCYNTGVMAATVSTFSVILEEYARNIGSTDCIFEHYARQQWLISYIIAYRGDLRVRVMPATFHTHGCHGAKPGTAYNGLSYTYHGVDVLFAHNLHPNMFRQEKSIAF